jgi:sulfofructose kinase
MKPRILCAGIATLDYVYQVEEMPTRAEKYRARDFRITTGGTAANAAVAMARLGADVQLFASLGDDPIGDDIAASLRAEGIDCSGLRRASGRASPVSAIIVDRIGERMVVSYADPLLPREVDWLPDRLPEGVGAVLGDTRWQEGSAHLFRLAREAGIPAVLDADREPERVPELLTLATHIAFSMQGLRDITGHSDARRALEAFSLGDEVWLGVTNGGEGLFFWSEGAVHHLPAFEIQPIDTLGAGDVWHGAFAVRIAERASALDAAQFATAAAALKCLHFGGRDGAPRRDEVEEFLRARGFGQRQDHVA